MSTQSNGSVPGPDDAGAFADLIAANSVYAEKFHGGHLEPVAARGLAIITCMDSRISPLEVLGLEPGDAKILRNAGGRVTDDVLRTLVLAVYLLGVTRVLVMPHTHCRMAQSTEEQIHALIAQRHGVDTSAISFETIGEPIKTLCADVNSIRSHPLLPRSLVVAGAIYDVSTGRMQSIEVPTSEPFPNAI